MNRQPVEKPKAETPSAGAVLLWCVFAGGLVTTLLLVEPPHRRGLEFWNPAGALRLLADLLVFYCIFVLPAFRRPREHRTIKALWPHGVVTYTGIIGLVMLSNLTDLGSGRLGLLVAFVVVSAAGSVLWAFALERRIGAYYASAAFAALGLPVVRFFCDELFRMEARWLDVLSPFTAWRLIVEGKNTWPAWVVWGCVLVAGGVAFLLHVRRKRA